MKFFLLLFIRFYKLVISPLLGNACRFEPSCSRYAEESLKRHSAARGLMLAVARLLRCHPFSEGGFDPVPSVKAR